MWVVREFFLVTAMVFIGVILGMKIEGTCEKMHTTNQELYDAIVVSYASGCTGVGTQDQNFFRAQYCKSFGEDFVKKFLPLLFKAANNSNSMVPETK